MRFGRPAMSRMVTRPFERRWMNLSVAVIWGSSLGIHGIAPMRTARGVRMFMGRILGRFRAARSSLLNHRDASRPGVGDRVLLLGGELGVAGPAGHVLGIAARVVAPLDRCE